METTSQLLDKFKATKEQVEYILATYPSARNNDFYLQWLWLKIFGGVKLPYVDWNVIREFSGRLETLRRVRQKIQNEDGRFPPDEETLRHRRNRQSIIRQNIRRF